MAAFTNGGDHFLLNKQWRGAVAVADDALEAENAKLRAVLTAQRTKQVVITQFDTSARTHSIYVPRSA